MSRATAVAPGVTHDRPALGARIYPILFGSELFKAGKRPAAWITLGLYFFIHLMDSGSDWWSSRTNPERAFALPERWPSVYGDDSMAMVVFLGVLLMLLVSSEFSWRTARQNVIDGLSRSQWFWGKAMLLPVLAAVLVLVPLLVATPFGLAGTDRAALDGSMFPAQLWGTIGGTYVGLLSAGSLALLIAVLVRSSGPAIGVFFAWFAFVERLIQAGLGRLFEGLRPILRHTPMSNAAGLFEYSWYGSSPPDGAALITSLWAAVGWTVLLIAAAYLSVSRRDL